MKKLLFIALLAAGIGAPAQGMEKIKSLFNPYTLFINNHKISDSDCCTICKENYKDWEGDTPQRAFLACHPSHSFHQDCINNWLKAGSTCPLCRKQIIADKAKLMKPVIFIKTHKFFTFILSNITTAIPFWGAQAILGKDTLEKYNLNINNTLGSILHSYATLFCMKKLDLMAKEDKKMLYPITRSNVNNVLLLSASKYMIDKGLTVGENLPAVPGILFCTANVYCYSYLMPSILQHKKVGNE